MATSTIPSKPTTTIITRKPTLKRGSKPYTYHVESQSRPGVFRDDAWRGYQQARS